MALVPHPTIEGAFLDPDGDFIPHPTIEGAFTISSTMVPTEGPDVVVGSRVPIEFRSLDEDVRRRGFRSAEQPQSLASCFGEIRRITGMPVEETVTDKPIPSSVVWEPKQGGRLDAVHQLGRVLGGTAVVNRAGAWEVIPDELGEPTNTLRLGEQGTVLDVAADIETDTVYNVVVGVFEDANRRPIYEVAQAPAGSDLDPNGLYGENTRYYSSDFVKTRAQAVAAVQSILELSLGSQQYDVQIRCHVNPTVELGQVVELVGWTRPLVGRVVNFTISDEPYMDVVLRASREL